MRKFTVAASAFAVFSCLSCSVEENAAAANPQSLSLDLAEGLADGMASGIAGIDFSKLFEYSTISEAGDRTNESVSLMKKDALELLAERPDCTHASVSFYLTSGKGTLHAVKLLSTKEKVLKEYNALTSGGVRPYTHLLAGSTTVYSQLEESLQMNYVKLKTGKSISAFINQKLADGGFAQFEVRVSRDGTVEVYGYNIS